MAPPYRLGKSPIATSMEAYLGSAANRAQLRSEMDATPQVTPAASDYGQRLAALDAALGALQGEPSWPAPPGQGLVGHLTQDVYGGEGGAERQRLYIEAMREVLRFTGDDPEQWTIGVLWSCGHPRNEAWIDVAPAADASHGHVTLVCLSTHPAVPWGATDVAELPEPPDLGRPDPSRPGPARDLVALIPGDDGSTGWYRPNSAIGAAQGKVDDVIRGIFGEPPG